MLIVELIVISSYLLKKGKQSHKYSLCYYSKYVDWKAFMSVHGTTFSFCPCLQCLTFGVHIEV